LYVMLITKVCGYRYNKIISNKSKADDKAGSVSENVENNGEKEHAFV